MSNSKVNDTATRQFIPGKGWEIKDDKHPATQQVPVHARPAAVALQTQPQITVEQIQSFAADFGLAVVNAEEYAATLARIAELEEALNEVAAEVDKVEEKPKSLKEIAKELGIKGYGNMRAADLKVAIAEAQKPKAPPVVGAVTAEAIEAAATLEDLSALMLDCEDENLLALADARAEVIKGGGNA